MTSLPQTNRIRVSVCSPCHNESGNVEALVSRVHAAMTPRYGMEFEQIIVDDASTDDSVAILERLQATRPTLNIVRHTHNQRERAVWKTAFDHARGDIVVLLAADLQSPPEEIPRLIDVVENEGFDVGTGRRQHRKDGVYYWAATRVLNTYMCAAFSLDVLDVSSSFFAVRRRYVAGLPLIANDHRYILACFRRRGASVKEIPVAHAARQSGVSHYSKSKVVRAVPELLAFTRRLRSGYYDFL